MALFDNTSFRMLEKGLDATWLKQKITLQNIANDTTPGYKAKTVEFSAVLKEKRKAVSNSTEDNAYDDENPISLAVRITSEENTNQTLDGNNVDAEKEQIALSDAKYQYEALSNKIDGDFARISSAIQR